MMSDRISRELAAVALSMALACCLGGCGWSAVREEPLPPAGAGHNVVLISIDTLRANRLSLYGYERPTSPRLEAFAAEAIVFDRFYHNGGGTLPSHMTMMTSLHPRTHGVRVQNGRVLESERLTLAELLHDAGYSTGAFVDGGFMIKKFGFDQGFEIYNQDGGHLERILPKVYRWLGEHSSERFLLFVHTYDVHSETGRLPYECPGDFTHRYTGAYDVDFDGCRGGRCASDLLTHSNIEIKKGPRPRLEIFSEKEIGFLGALYDGCINYVDERISELLDHLREAGLYDDSLIVITSDHGEEFAEHGLFLHAQPGFEEITRIPLIVKLPGAPATAAPAGLRIPHLAAVVDLMPTILDVLDLPVPEQAQGRSLMPAVLRGEAVRDAVQIGNVLRTPRWKYFGKRQELYDLEADPGERRDLAEREAGLAEDLRRRTHRLQRRNKLLFTEFQERLASGGETVGLTEKEIEALKALGYLQ